MLKILLPVDGTENSLPAVRYVARLKAANLPVFGILTYVHAEPVRLGDVEARITPERVKALEQELADRVFGPAEGVLREAGIEFRREFRVGEDIGPVIAKLASDAKCDGIVMGTHGGGPLAKLFMGSTAMKVISLAKVPVTVVR
jgi:nucleotide-binding universal stress UspA family protein